MGKAFSFTFQPKNKTCVLSATIIRYFLCNNKKCTANTLFCDMNPRFFATNDEMAFHSFVH